MRRIQKELMARFGLEVVRLIDEDVIRIEKKDAVYCQEIKEKEDEMGAEVWP